MYTHTNQSNGIVLTMMKCALCAALALMSACTPHADVEFDETGGSETGDDEAFRAAPVTACVDHKTGECTLDGFGNPCPLTSWDACSSGWQPRACVGGGPCFVVHEGDECPEGSWDACKN